MRIQNLILPIAISFAIAVFIWFSGSSSINLSSDGQKSVMDSAIKGTTPDSTEPTPTPLNASTALPKPPSAKKIQQQLDNQAQLALQAEITDQKVTELNRSLETLEQQLKAQGIQFPVAQTATEATSDVSESLQQRIEAVRAHLKASTNK